MTKQESEVGSGLVGGSKESKTAEIPSNLAVEQTVRGYILDYLGLEDDETMIKEVVIRPQTTEVTYQEL